MKTDELSAILDAWQGAAPPARFSASVLDAIDRSPQRRSPGWLLAAVAGMALLVGSASLWLAHGEPERLIATAQNADLGEIRD